MTTPATPMDTVTLERRIRASPETVFAFFTDREKWLSWMDADDAFPLLTLPFLTAPFLTVAPPERLVFTWDREGGTPAEVIPTRVEITLEPTPAGTVLHLIHSGLPTAEACEAHAELWQRYVDRLALHAEDGDPGPSVTG
ncbi:SRPBCC domain-containing protein [Streptomyces sp. NPDC058401]|uniref:SRPBCC family protein n=1 Tax=Streptomyces sp. NPDC058401 TaxID=3346480 RepID=UPI00365D7CF2